MRYYKNDFRGHLDLALKSRHFLLTVAFAIMCLGNRFTEEDILKKATSKNHLFSEAVALRCPPLEIDFRRRTFIRPASEKGRSPKNPTRPNNHPYYIYIHLNPKLSSSLSISPSPSRRLPRPSLSFLCRTSLYKVAMVTTSP